MTPPQEAPMTFREEMRQRLTALETQTKLTHEAVTETVSDLTLRVAKLEKFASRLAFACIGVALAGTYFFPKIGGAMTQLAKLLFP